MRGFYFLTFLFFFTFVPAAPTNKWPKIDFEIKNIYEKTVKWGTDKNGSLVVFVSEHCPYDLDWLDRISQIGQWAIKNNFFVYVINPYNNQIFEQNNLNSMKKRIENWNKSIEYIWDPEQIITKQFKPQRTPVAYLFNADKARVYYGLIDDQVESEQKTKTQYLQQALNNLVNSKPITHAMIQPIGCLISNKEEK
ncbi:MAG: hypothetical protein KDD58_07095 [Bdellovibrionales bacterium]|nr:hypothetical protein [Bdellovibrionales bacterium]